MAGGGGAVQGGTGQSQDRRFPVRYDLRGPVRQAGRRRNRGAVRRPRRAGRRQVRRHGPDWPAMAVGSRSQGPRPGNGGTEEPRHRRKARDVGGIGPGPADRLGSARRLRDKNTERGD
ncbi:hypothetical protein MTBSS4_100085 [Magnetospirillum sp. SS-4]|nr:hypothetical protein MTBSS4_100085 [Magnetospirillum sp. SS-4]